MGKTRPWAGRRVGGSRALPSASARAGGSWTYCRVIFVGVYYALYNVHVFASYAISDDGVSRARSAARAFRRDCSLSTVNGCAPPNTRRAIRSVSSSVVTASRTYNVLRDVSEESRGLPLSEILRGLFKTETVPILEMYANPNDSPEERASRVSIIAVFMIMCLFRCCYHDNTVVAFAECPRQYDGDRDRSAPLCQGIHFNLSPRERKRLREYTNGIRRDRRMPYIISRELILRKSRHSKNAAGRCWNRRRLFTLEDAPASDDLFRVVVSFL